MKTLNRTHSSAFQASLVYESCEPGPPFLPCVTSMNHLTQHSLEYFPSALFSSLHFRSLAASGQGKTVKGMDVDSFRLWGCGIFTCKKEQQKASSAGQERRGSKLPHSSRAEVSKLRYHRWKQWALSWSWVCLTKQNCSASSTLLCLCHKPCTHFITQGKGTSSLLGKSLTWKTDSVLCSLKGR